MAEFRQGPYIDQRCAGGCGRTLVTQRAWNESPRLERKAMAAEGYAKQHRGPYCTRCSYYVREAA